MAERVSLESLYDEHACALYGFLLNFTRDEAAARDLLQEVFLKLAREPHLLDGIREPRGFLIRVARNAAIDQIRRREARHRRLARILWPSPWAWAALVGVWMVILALNSSVTVYEQKHARLPQRHVPPESIRMARAEYDRMLREILGEEVIADKPRRTPNSPRSSSIPEVRFG